MLKIRQALLFLLLALAGISYAQSKTVSGQVTSEEDGQPIPGVTIVEKGTPTNGTITDISGNYELTVKDENAILVFTFMGMETIEVPTAGKNVVKVRLSSSAIAMDEVMVVAYGTAKKSSFTGSAQVLSADKIADVKVESLDKALAGKMAGVRVSSKTGAPGASGDIQIRGIGSISGSTTPLYVIDGVAVGSGSYGHSESSSNILSTINPGDIESMTVLKDAAAASLYGSRAANGVVIITTKKGRAGDTKFNFKANYGISEMATNSYQHISGEAYYDYLHKALENYYYNSQGILFSDKTADQTAAGLKFADDEIWVKDQNGANWRDEVYGKGRDQDYQLSVAGGNQKSRYYLSAAYKNVEGLVKNRSFDRYSGVINVDSKPKKWLDLSAKAQLAFTDQLGGRDQSNQKQGMGYTSPLSMIFSMYPTEPAYNEDGSLNLDAGMGKVKNPHSVLSIDEQFLRLKTYRALNNLSAKIQILPTLSFKSTNAVDFVSTEVFEYWGPNSIDGESLNGLGNRDQNRIITTTSSNIFNFAKTFGRSHNLNALAGFEAQNYERLFVRATAKDYSTVKLPELSSGKADAATSIVYRNYMQSFLANLNYNYENRYYLAAGIRQDESSKLGVDNRKGVFWSASAAWRFTEEDFISPFFLSDGKLRFSYGTNGTLPGNSYDHLWLYNVSGQYGPNSIMYLDRALNANLGWEKSNNLNLGLDLTFLERISFTAEYYRKYTKDLILDLPTSYSTGFASTLKNAGEISNSGIEFEVRAYDVLNSKFKWNIDFSLSTLAAKVEKLPEGEDIILGDGNLYLYSEGEDLYSFYLPTWVGVNDETGFSEFLIDPTKAATADNLTMNYSEAGRSAVAKAFPDFSGGLTNTFNYKGFTLTALTTFQFGGNLFDYPGYFFHHDGVRGTTSLAQDVEGNWWTPENPTADNPQPVYVWGYRPDRWSTKHIKSTDHIRLKEIGLSYNVPKKLYQKYSISNLNINFGISNVAYLYAATKDMELEVNLNGYRTTDTPLPRTYSLGLSLDF